MLSLLLLIVLVASACGSSATAGVDGPAVPPTATDGTTAADGTADPSDGDAGSDTAPPATQPPFSGTPEALVVEVVGERPRDSSAFTQGYELLDGRLFESTGAVNGESTLREVDPVDGSVVRSITIPTVFAEGLTIVDDRLIMLTWRAGTAIEYDVETFTEARRYDYPNEGWGLCELDDANGLAMSDGTDVITFRDPETFEALRTVNVADQGVPIADLNELECVDGAIWANVWKTDFIVRIDPASGAVTARVDASGLLSDDEAAEADVLNGIAYDTTTETFLLTGKWWPRTFEVRFVPAA